MSKTDIKLENKHVWFTHYEQQRPFYKLNGIAYVNSVANGPINPKLHRVKFRTGAASEPKTLLKKTRPCQHVWFTNCKMGNYNAI